MHLDLKLTMRRLEIMDKVNSVAESRLVKEVSINSMKSKTQTED